MKLKDVYKIIMQEYRCPNCNRLFFKAKIHGNYGIQIKCPRCKKIIDLSRNIRDK